MGARAVVLGHHGWRWEQKSQAEASDTRGTRRLSQAGDAPARQTGIRAACGEAQRAIWKEDRGLPPSLPTPGMEASLVVNCGGTETGRQASKVEPVEFGMSVGFLVEPS